MSSNIEIRYNEKEKTIRLKDMRPGDFFIHNDRAHQYIYLEQEGDSEKAYCIRYDGWHDTEKMSAEKDVFIATSEEGIICDAKIILQPQLLGINNNRE